MNDKEVTPILQDGIYNEEWLTHISELPDMIELENNLSELMAIDKTQMSSDEIKALFYQKVVLFPNESRLLRGNAFNG